MRALNERPAQAVTPAPAEFQQRALSQRPPSGVWVQVAVDGGAGHAEDVGDLLDGVLAGVVRARAAASGVRLALWRPAGQPLRTLRIARFERVFDLRPASWRPSPPRPDLPPTETRPGSRRGGWASGRDRPSALSGAAARFVA
jgi:hypothetical protein